MPVSRRLGILAAAAVGLLALTGTDVLGGFTGTVVDPGNTMGSGSLVLSDAIGGQTCTSSGTAVSSDGATCPASPYGSALGDTATTTVSSVGSVAPTAAALAPTESCGVQELADSSPAASDTALAMGGTTYQAPGPMGGAAVSFNGTNGWGETLESFYDPTTYSITAWFNAPAGSATGGVIMGFTNAQYDTGQSMWDRILWMDPAGRLEFGTWTGNGPTTITSPGAYNDGTWHEVVVTMSDPGGKGRKGGKGGMKMYVDGAQVAASPNTTSQDYTGYWHLGWAPMASSWSTAGSVIARDPFWTGSLADLAVFPSALTPSQVTTLWGQTAQTAYAAALTADGPTAQWDLQDTGSTLYSGPIADVAGSTTYVDASGHGNTGTGEGGVTAGAAGPLGGRAASFDGATGTVQTTTQYPGPQSFSIAAWFQTTTSGSIISFTNQQANAGQTDWDRQVWIDPQGHVVFGVYPGHVEELQSPGSYADGAWHFVVAEVSPAGMELYVDGALVADNPGVTSAQVFDGYWHLGWSNAQTGWTDPPSNDYFTGSLAQVAIEPSALDQAQVTALYGAGTVTSYANAVVSDGATSYWPLTDDNAAACGDVGLTVQATHGATTTCLYPVASGACPAVSAAYLFGGLTFGVPLPPPGTRPTTLAITTGSGNLPGDAVGLHLAMGLALSGSNGPWTATLVHGDGYVVLR